MSALSCETTTIESTTTTATAERRLWVTPEFTEFEVAPEVTAYAGLD